MTEYAIKQKLAAHFKQAASFFFLFPSRMMGSFRWKPVYPAGCLTRLIAIALSSWPRCRPRAYPPFLRSRFRYPPAPVPSAKRGFQLYAIFSAIAGGKGSRDSLALVEDISPLIAAGALCSFGRSMVQPALSGVALFRSELEAHIVKKTCPAGKCAAFAKYVIDPSLCTGCGDCLDACEYDAIDGKSGFIHVIDEAMCEKCDACRKACPERAILLNAPPMRLPSKPVRAGTFR